MTVLLVVFEACRLLLRLMLLVLVRHLLRASFVAIRRKPPSVPAAASEATAPDPLPVVTVQLPMRNEFYVAERILRVASRLDWPRDRLQIQVLDDSDDATHARVRALCESLAAEGVPIELLHREAPDGYKAGALNAGLERARGDLVAIFDADCVPAADFLRRVVPSFSDERVGLVQVRWSFLNRDVSVFTRLQAILLDGLFVVDQAARSLLGMPFQFNGTNGVFRRRCLEEAGRWRGAMLAEDVDLSFRAVLAGWKLLHRTDYAVPTEIPETMPAFRAQQRRWALGSAQVLRALFGTILRSDAPLAARRMMLVHLGRHAIDPLILFTCVTAPFTTLYAMPFLLDYGVLGNAVLVGLVVAAVVLHYGVASRIVGRPVWEIGLVPLVVPLAIGLSLAYTSAFLQGLFRSGGEFVRTPKSGEDGPRTEGPVYRSPFAPLAIMEVGFGALHAFFAHRAFAAGYLAYAGFFAAVSLGFLWVGLASLPWPGRARVQP